MADVFVSYARQDEPQAVRVADALRAAGYQVWRDDELPAHRAYAEVIEERLNAAKAVLVLWSAEAAKSQWVRAEADTARTRGTLIQASLDGTIPPIPFNQIQCADLKASDGPAGAPGWPKLVASVRALAGSAAPLQTSRSARQQVSVCVLPFANMSGDAEQEYFSDGISEDITTDLSKVSALEVIARNTAFQFKGQSIDVCDVAKKLGVSHVLEGSVRKAGGRVRITAQLIDGNSGGHVWAERYDRDLTDIFAIQDELSKAIVDALKVKLLPEERKAIEQRGTSNVDAYNLYLMARQYWISGNWGDTRQLELVIRVCERAVDLDPQYARAWGLLALAQCILHFTFAGTDDDGMAAANRALSIDPNIAEAHCVRARHSYEQHDFEQSDAQLAQALALEPESWEVNREAARLNYFRRRFPEAVHHYEKAVALDDTDFHSWGMLSSAYAALGDKAGTIRAAHMAVEHSERVLAHDPTNGAALGIGATGLAALGDRDRLKEWIERAMMICPDNLLMRYNFACLMALNFNDAEAAIGLIERDFDGYPPSALKAVVADPDLDSIRDHPKFKRMMAKAHEILAAEANVTESAAAAAPLRS
ncbi:MAG TPA: TIR domain-containing protein [Sphingomicrobium sp.]|jgi:adenylate cyclase|nr:TIR domain-containing protein [Sphingomicrobium sp.]